MPAETDLQRPSGYRFGTFEARISDSTLLRNGRPIRIQKFPFAVLVALVENSGRVVLREELKERLWGDHTYVNFDNGLHVAVAKLRETLGENASKPNLIKTVPGKGYQFIGLADPVFRPREEPLAIRQNPIGIAPPVEFQTAPQHVRPDVVRKRLSITIAGALFALCCIGGRVFFQSYHRRVLIAKDAGVLIGSFVNATGNQQLDGVFSAPFRLKLQESPYLHILAPPSRLTLSTSSLSDRKAEMAACREGGAKIWVGGELRIHGSGYKIAVTSNRCSDGDELGVRSGYADSTNGILPVLGETIESLRRDMGEPADMQERFNTSLAKATTSSAAALRAFSLGDQRRDEGDSAEAIANYKLAVALDPQFALAYGRLGAVYKNLFDTSLSKQFYTKAYQLRERTTDPERLYISSHYFDDVTGEVEQSIATHKLWRELYHYDKFSEVNLAGLYLNIGQPDKAIALVREAVNLNPSNMTAQGNLAKAYLELNDYSDLSILCQNSLVWAKGAVVLHEACYWLGFAEDDQARMAREFQWAKGTGAEPIFLEDQALTLIYHGQLKAARSLLLVATQMAQKNLDPGVAAGIELDAAIIEASLGSLALAPRDVTRALAMDSGSMAHAVAALALAQTGDLSGAESESREAREQSPVNTIQNSVILAAVNAIISLHRGNAKDAIQELETARPYEFNLTIPFATIYYRGLAYQANQQPQKASTEFGRIIQNHTVYPASPYILLAEVEQVRALEASGDHEAAAGKAQELFLRWKASDPNFPLLLRLRAYSKTM